jgi:LexA-binding, inner membrane-associated putative hydrolase
MFAVDHAATALLIKRRFPSVSLTPLLLSVQAMELAWVGLNYLGIERTTTEASVRSVADIHLAYMPFSHSVATAAGGALLAWLLVEKGLGRPAIGRAIGIGIFSHLVLDVLTHAQDIVLWPGSTLPALGLGLYDRAPMWGFALEMVYGVICWRVYRGSRSLLAMIVLGNLANITLFSAAIPGPEQHLAGHPLMVVTVIFVQIVATLALIQGLATRPAPGTSMGGGALRTPQISQA